MPIDILDTAARLMAGNLVDRRRMLALLAGTVLTPAFGNAALAQAKPKRGGILKVAMPTAPANLDPLLGGQDTETKYLFAIYDTLVAWDFQTLEAKPQLATDWNYPDPKTLVMNLRQGVTFHDDTPFNAEAVKVHLDRGKNLPASSAKGDLSTIDSVTVTGPYQITIKLKQADSSLPLILSDRAGMINSPTAVTKLGDAYPRNPVGTGPWKFSRWVENEVVSVVRFDKYWQGPVYLDGIDYKAITDPNTAARSVIAGENDIAHRLFPQQKTIADRAGKTVQTISPTLTCYQVVFNVAKTLKDVRLRQAINLAVDRDAFNKVTQLGLGTPASTLMPTGYWAHDNRLDNYYAHDPAAARKLVADAGYANGVDLELYGYIDQAAQQRSELLIEQLRQANIRVKLVAGLNSDINGRFFAKGEGDICLTAWGGRAEPAQTFLTMYSKGGFTNTGHIEPPAPVVQLLNDIIATSDQTQRAIAFKKLEQQVLANALSCSLYFAPEINVIAKRVRGYVPNLVGKPKFNDVWLDV